MGYVFFVFISPISSIGSPTTFVILPNVSGPTGTCIGAPVSVTSSPLFRPSVADIAIDLSVFSPRCCATSRTTLLPSTFTCKALRIGGNSFSNSTSTTGPIICLIFPTFLLIYFSNLL